MKSLVRLDKYLADMGIGTRSQVKEKIRKGLVSVNGQTASGPEQKVDTGTDQILFAGTPVGYVHYEYYMLNKPSGVLSAARDKRAKTVVDLIDEKKRKDLFPAGRLDKDTQGLLIITNDGPLAHDLLSPKKHVPKVYYARIEGCVSEADVQAFSRGLKVDEDLTAQPARLTVITVSQKENQSHVLIEIHEGKFHQLKRMFLAIGKSVLFLKRLTMGPLHLDPTLLPGQYRSLTEDEIRLLKEAGKGQNSHTADLSAHTCGGSKSLDPAAILEDRGMLNNIDAVIFDLDGTLIDSMGVWEAIDMEYLGRFGISMPDDLQEAIAGISVTQTAVYFKETFHIPDSIRKIINDWNDMAMEHYTSGAPLKPGAMLFLKYLKYRNIPCAIATSNSRDLTRAVLESHSIGGYFQIILTGEDIHKGKPEPDVYLEAAARLKVSPDRCLVFEDIPYGIMAGQRAGMRCAAVFDTFSASKDDEKRRLANYYIRDYLDVMNQTYEELK